MNKILLSCLIGYSCLSFANSENFESIFPEEAPVSELAQRPMIPKILAPQPLSEVSAGAIELKWTAVDKATGYALQVSADPIFFNLLVNETLYRSTSYTIKDLKLDSNKNYYWRVAALKEDNQPGSIKSLFNRSSFTIK